jgi:hypothetical protein
MPLPLAIAGVVTWCGSAWGVVQPFIPGIVAVSSWTFGSHLVAFGGSWLSARWYSKNCIGAGLIGFYQSYWKMGSPTCMALLTSHVALLAIAIASMVCTLLMFLWLWYTTFKRLVYPIKKLVQEEFDPHKKFAPHKKYGNKSRVKHTHHEPDEEQTEHI